MKRLADIVSLVLMSVITAICTLMITLIVLRHVPAETIDKNSNRATQLRHAIESLTATRDALHAQVIDEREALRQLQSERQQLELESHVQQYIVLTNIVTIGIK